VFAAALTDPAGAKLQRAQNRRGEAAHDVIADRVRE
jgi:hypothetical protein